MTIDFSAHMKNTTWIYSWNPTVEQNKNSTLGIYVYSLKISFSWFCNRFVQWN